MAAGLYLYFLLFVLRSTHEILLCPLEVRIGSAWQPTCNYMRCLQSGPESPGTLQPDGGRNQIVKTELENGKEK